jgi:competence protein ComFB
LNVRVYNVMEEIVEKAVNEYNLQRPNFYHCKQCLADIKAITLNRIPPKYVVSHKGEVFSKVGTMANQYMSDVYKELSLAIQKVESDRHCGIASNNKEN